MKITCPKCQRAIPTEDVNVGTDIALCRQCDETFSFAELLGQHEDPTVDLTRPPKGVWFRQDMHGFELGCTTRSPMAFILVPFMCVWSGFSLGGIYGTQIYSHTFNWGVTLFGIPFIAFSILFWSFALMAVCGKIVVSVKEDQGKVFTGVGPVGWSRKFKWSGVREVRESLKTSGKGDRYPTIMLQGETRLSFGDGIHENRRYFMLRALRMLLRKRSGTVAASR
jgi:hypothetical protein